MKTIVLGDCVGYCETGFHYGTVVAKETKGGKIFFNLKIQKSGKIEDVEYKRVPVEKCWYERRG